MDARTIKVLDNMNAATRNLLTLAVEAHEDGNTPLYEEYRKAAADLMAVTQTIALNNEGQHEND